MDAYVGDPISFCASALERAGGNRADCSHAQVRESLTTCGVLPIGCSSETHAKLPSHVRAILLAGHPGSGKTLLTHAVANGAGATFFNVSPRNTDDVYAGKQSSVMLHTVFKVAKMTAPSVIYIDEVEKVFCTDKKLSKTWGLRESAGRIKKDLLKEVKALKPGDRVVVIGNAREPWTCAKKDHKAFCGFFDKIFVSPAPEYGARRAVWTALIARRGERLDDASRLRHVNARAPQRGTHPGDDGRGRSRGADGEADRRGQPPAVRRGEASDGG